MNSKDKMLFREALIDEYRTQFHRAFYWHVDNQFIPVLSVCVIAKKTRKLFENVYRYCRVSARDMASLKATPWKSDDDSAESTEERATDCMSDAHLLIETARKMQQLLIDQFNKPERIRNYTALLREGVGHGKYSTQEQNQFGPLLDLFPCNCDDSDFNDVEDDDNYESTFSSEDDNVKAVQSPLKKTMKEAIDDIESKPHVKVTDIDEFPTRPATRIRWNRPRMTLNTLLLLRQKSGLFVAVRLVQILRDRACLEEFIYVLKSPREVCHSHYSIISEHDLLEMILNSNGCIVKDVGEETTSKSALSVDIYSYNSINHTSGLRYFPSLLSRRNEIDKFIMRIEHLKFKEMHQAFLDALKGTVLKFISSSSKKQIIKTHRIGWAKWVPCGINERWYAWHIVSLLLLTNSVKDDIVKDIVEVMFARFDNPLTVSANPVKLLDFLTSKAKDFAPLGSSFDASKDTIMKGPNYCYQKASYILAMSKTVVLLWCHEHLKTCSSITWKTLQSKYCDTRNKESLLKPIPRNWLRECNDSNDTLFPATYSSSFYSNLPGIGLKMRHLCAEAIYNVVVGPAIDCHCIRFCVEMGTVHCSMPLEQMSTCLISIYRNDQLVDLNEIPATISQILASCNETKAFVESLHCIGKKHQLDINLKAFLMHYCRPH